MNLNINEKNRWLAITQLVLKLYTIFLSVAYLENKQLVFVAHLIVILWMLKPLEVPLQLCSIDPVQKVWDGLPRPRNGPSQWTHLRHVHNRAYVAEIPVRYPEIQRAEALGGDDSRPVLQVGKALLQLVVHWWAEREVVDEHYGGRRYLFSVFFQQEVALDQLVLSKFLPVEPHPGAEVLIHRLEVEERKHIWTRPR